MIMRTLLMATDFSTEANNAMHYAAAVAQKAGAELILFHLYTISVHTVNARLPPSAIQHSMEIAQKQLDQLSEQVAQQYAIKVKPLWAMGGFYEEIKRTIDEYNCDIVVMGMPEKSFEQDLLGNTTTSALNKLHVPVLAIPLQAQFSGIRKMVFATDREKGFHAQVLEKVRETAKIFDAEVTVFHVDKEIEALTEQTTLDQDPSLASGLEGVQYTYKNVQSKWVIEAIQEEVKAQQADLLIMVPYRYGFWSALVHRSKTRAMASRSDVPLLSIPV
jgi:nucleotide-binding universal stress UspA family protein